jgi:hypothetical protein
MKWLTPDRVVPIISAKTSFQPQISLRFSCALLLPSDLDLFTEQGAACRGLLPLRHSCRFMRQHLDFAAKPIGKAHDASLIVSASGCAALVRRQLTPWRSTYGENRWSDFWDQD